MIPSLYLPIQTLSILFFYVKILEKVDMQNVKVMGNDGIY